MYMYHYYYYIMITSLGLRCAAQHTIQRNATCDLWRDVTYGVT